jgi:hypothetical protein
MHLKLPLGAREIIAPSNAEVLEIAREAAPLGLLLCSNGERSVLSREVPPGFTRIAVRVKGGAA